MWTRIEEDPVVFTPCRDWGWLYVKGRDGRPQRVYHPRDCWNFVYSWWTTPGFQRDLTGWFAEVERRHRERELDTQQEGGHAHLERPRPGPLLRVLAGRRP